jgi:hypothetical protein
MVETYSATVNKQIIAAGGRNRAERLALDWFNTVKKNVNEKVVSPYNTYLRPGKIFIFNYDPKTKDILEFYDRNPIVLSLGLKETKSNGPLDLGINLNFLPFKIKLVVFDVIYKNYQLAITRDGNKYPNRALEQRGLKISYEIIKTILKQYNILFALRSYYVDRRTNCYAVSYEHWPDVSLLDVKDIEGATLKQIYGKYYAMMRERDNTGKFKKTK